MQVSNLSEGAWGHTRRYVHSPGKAITMLSKKLVATLGVLTATALAPAAVAHAAPGPAPAEPARVLNLGTQVGSEGIRPPQADGIIAILIGVVSNPASSIASDGIGVSYRLHSPGAPSGDSAPVSQLVPARQEYPNLDGTSQEPAA